MFAMATAVVSPSSAVAGMCSQPVLEPADRSLAVAVAQAAAARAGPRMAAAAQAAAYAAAAQQTATSSGEKDLQTLNRMSGLTDPLTTGRAIAQEGDAAVAAGFAEAVSADVAEAAKVAEAVAEGVAEVVANAFTAEEPSARSVAVSEVRGCGAWDSDISSSTHRRLGFSRLRTIQMGYCRCVWGLGARCWEAACTCILSAGV